MQLLKPRNYRLREDQYQWMEQEAKRLEEGNVSRFLRRLIDDAKAKAKKFAGRN